MHAGSIIYLNPRADMYNRTIVAGAAAAAAAVGMEKLRELSGNFVECERYGVGVDSRM